MINYWATNLIVFIVNKSVFLISNSDRYWNLFVRNTWSKQSSDMRQDVPIVSLVKLRHNDKMVTRSDLRSRRLKIGVKFPKGFSLTMNYRVIQNSVSIAAQVTDNWPTTGIWYNSICFFKSSNSSWTFLIK